MCSILDLVVDCLFHINLKYFYHLDVAEIANNLLHVSARSNYPRLKLRYCATCSENHVISDSAVLSQYTRLTDDDRRRQTFRDKSILRSLAKSVFCCPESSYCDYSVDS